MMRPQKKSRAAFTRPSTESKPLGRKREPRRRPHERAKANERSRGAARCFLYLGMRSACPLPRLRAANTQAVSTIGAGRRLKAGRRTTLHLIHQHGPTVGGLCESSGGTLGGSVKQRRDSSIHPSTIFVHVMISELVATQTRDIMHCPANVPQQSPAVPRVHRQYTPLHRTYTIHRNGPAGHTDECLVVVDTVNSQFEFHSNKGRWGATTVDGRRR